MTTQYDYASFYPGQPFPYKQAETPSDYLETALAAERYIASKQREDADGVYWQEDGQSAYDISLFKGASGIAFFYLELHKATGERRFADIARSAALRIGRVWRKSAEKPVILFPGDIRFGLQLGVPGAGSILTLAYRAFKEPEIEQALRDIVVFLAENAKRDEEGGAYWNDNGSPISDGGAVLFLARYLELFDDEDAKKLAVDVGEHILRSGRAVGDGLSFDKPEPPANDFGPNLETGTAGVAFVLEHVYRLTGDGKYLEAAEKGVTYLRTLLVPQKKGHLLPVRVEQDGTYFKGNADVHSPLGDKDPDHGELPGDYTEPICYLGQCCGPFGTGRLYYSLTQDTGDDSYLDLIRDSIDGYESLGAPEHKSAGLWGVYYCCGHASQLQFFIGLYERYHDQRWLELARRAAAVLLGSAEKREDGSVDWPVAFLRLHPSRLNRGIGYYAGAAGIAHSLIQIYQVETGRFQADRLADDPFPTQPVK